jgi:hypothetical protein
MKTLALLFALTSLQAQPVLDESGWKMEHNGCWLKGNTLWECTAGTICLEHEDGLPASTLRLYGADAQILGELSTPQSINMRLNDAGNRLAWYNGSELCLLDLANWSLEHFPGSPIFTFDGEELVSQIFVDEHVQLCRGSERWELPEPVRAFRWHHGQLFLSLSRGMLALKDQQLYSLESQPNLSHPAPQVVSSREHESIPYPLESLPGPDHPVGNSYGEHQYYGGSPYLHPGVDFLGNANEEVRAVKSGVVKAVLTTGGSFYWRVAVGPATADNSQGYLYAHLNEASITVMPGDSVHVGQVLGTLVDWPVAGFTHLHFARIADTGLQWDGNWWTLDDPLQDVVGLEDLQPPVFEDCFPGELFAFRGDDGLYQDPQNLSGTLSVIAHVHDIVNSDWRLDVSRLEWELVSSTSQETVFSSAALPRDFALDVYGSSEVSSAILNTIYSTDTVLETLGNYDVREYYPILTSDNGDGIYQPEDGEVRLNTALYSDGEYLLRVTAHDAMGNQQEATMSIGLANQLRITDLRISLVGSDVLLEWTPLDPASSYIVERRLSDESWLEIAQTTTASWQDSNVLQTQERASYRVRCILQR